MVYYLIKWLINCILIKLLKSLTLYIIKWLIVLQKKNMLGNGI